MNKEDCPLVSIVIPAFNEEQYIGLCIESVKNLNYPPERLEIIVVDNGSSDKTVEIASSFNVEVYIWPKARVGAVRNYGVSKSSGDVVAFLDGDCIPPKDWLINALSFMDENSVDVVGGTYLLRDNPSWVESAWVIDSQPQDKISRALVGGSIIIKREAFLSVGGFDETINAGEDSALGEALTNSGHRIHLLKYCAVVHLGYPRTLFNFTRRQYWHASSYLRSKRAERLDIIFLIVIAFGLSILSMPLSLLIHEKLIYLNLTAIVVLPAALSFKRLRSSSFRSFRFDHYLKIYILDFCYLAGRFAGCVKSLLTELKVISDKKTHY